VLLCVVVFGNVRRDARITFGVRDGAKGVASAALAVRR
jgi:hypothetical protein